MSAAAAASASASTTQRFLHIAGFSSCGFYTRALSVLHSVSILFPTRVKVIRHEFADRAQYRTWLLDDDKGFRNYFVNDSKARKHATSPFVWFSAVDQESDDEPVPSDIESYLGGHDDTLDWCRSFLQPNDGGRSALSSRPIMVPDGHESMNPYDYDLVVIGGGSGGMAASKEASTLGARVACLDFVKPSPKGTTWGLGGTCVNVGCIPKKLFHHGSLLRESIKSDSAAFGIKFPKPGNGEDEKMEEDNDMMMYGGGGAQEEPETTASWGMLKDNIQNYIRSLNFKYRVRLREKNVEYLNKLGKFLDRHTLQVTDKKGRVGTITSSRFLIATGGRPSPLSCPGGELAISSDDVFSLPDGPGKTLCVGASYISLECAGFLAGLGHDVTVAVRSILLRGFDQQCANKIGQYMEENGVKFKREVTPSKLEKVPGDAGGRDRIRVTFSDGSSDTYDTVLTAIGRIADTSKLGLENVGVEVNPKNGRILGKHEQTSCPNIYAVGDVLDKTPELTPVAIQAGIMLSRRLFGGSNEPMDYVNVCTTVFTPLEYSCVGLSEDDALEKFGKDNVEVYHSEFVPLEWSLSHHRASMTSAYAKVVVDKTPQQKVLGMHYVGPNAGEVMQGFGVAMKMGLTYRQLADTVGIHPTSAEEIVTLAITKSSGEDAAAGGC